MQEKKKKTGKEKAPGVKRGILGVWLIIRGFAQFQCLGGS